MKKNRFLAVSILAVILLIVSFIRISDQESTGEYDAWCDINHDGKIDIKDIAIVAKKFGTLGDAIVGLANGDFELGTFDGWEVFPYGLVGSPQLSTVTIHEGSFSASVSDAYHNSWIRQPLGVGTPLSAASDLVLEGWVYPLKVGLLGTQYPYSGISLNLYNKSSRQRFFIVMYSWCMSNHLNSSTGVWFYLPSFNASEWNFFSRNVTADMSSIFGDADLSDVLLYSIEVRYHYSNESPGAFYVDDLRIS